MLKKFLITIMAIGILSGCGPQKTSLNNFPMITKDLGAGPWQIVTYGGNKVYHETIALDGKGVSVRSESVYVNNKSQFVYRDGTPITTYDGRYLYWNQDGLVINKHLQRVSEDEVFVVDGKPMPPNTAMRLRDYHKSNPMITLAGIDKGE